MKITNEPQLLLFLDHILLTMQVADFDDVHKTVVNNSTISDKNQL